MEIQVDPKLELDEETARVLEAHARTGGHPDTEPAPPVPQEPQEPRLARGLRLADQGFIVVANLWIGFFGELAKLIADAGRTLERWHRTAGPIEGTVYFVLAVALLPLVLFCGLMTWVPKVVRWALIVLISALGFHYLVLRAVVRVIWRVVAALIVPVGRAAGRIIALIPVVGPLVVGMFRLVFRARFLLAIVVASVGFLSAPAPTWLGPSVHQSWAEIREKARQRLGWDSVERSFHRAIDRMSPAGSGTAPGSH